MSYSIMEDLFYGHIIPWERRSVHTPQRKALEEKIENEKQYFMGKMSAADCNRFQELENLFVSVVMDEEVDIYSHGFMLGILLMVEVMKKMEDIVNE